MTCHEKMVKRFLSIILIAAALFALYGDYVNITDIFACREYWEETSSKSEDDLNKLGAGLTRLKRSRKSYKKAKKQLARGKKSLAAAEARYETAGENMTKLKSEYQNGVSTYKSLTGLIRDISTVRLEYRTWKSTYDRLSNSRNTVIKAVSGPDPDKFSTVRDMLLTDIAELISDKAERKAFTKAVRALDNDKQTAAGYRKFASKCDTVSGTIDSLFLTEYNSYQAAKTIAQIKSNEDLIATLRDSHELYEATIVLVKRDLVEGDDAKGVVDRAMEGSELDIKIIREDSNTAARKEMLKNFNSLKWLRYYVTSSMKTCSSAVKISADKLSKGQDSIAKQISSISSEILGSSAYKNAVRKTMGKKAVTLLEEYSKKPGPLNTSSTNFAGFEKQMDTKPGLNASLLKAQELLNANRNTLKKAVTAVKTKYAASYRSYKAYPAKLENARKKLEKLEKSIAEYEKGEKASRKGIAALVNEKPDGDLESIKDRVGGNENYDDKNGNLDVDKGMEAVDAGEAYLKEAGDTITNELTGRAIASGASIVAAVLALLAALLSLIRSNRGGATLACIATVVAAAGTALAKSAGDVFSKLAGSTVGDLPWTALMILAGVAMIFAIVHFSAKIEEPLTDD